jgi:hypothetical protein
MSDGVVKMPRSGTTIMDFEGGVFQMTLLPKAR